MSRVREVLARGALRLRGEDAWLEADLLLGHALGVSRAWLIAHADDDVHDDNRAAFDALIERRARGEPVAYLTGVRGFHGIELQVTPDVLIPRAETELLVELALQRIPRDQDCAIADLGTGSGAVALAIAKERPKARVLATDANDAALIVARRNATKLGLRNVEFAQGDWCAAFGDAREFDVIVANPPYIAVDDSHLSQGDLRFEPREALVSGSDGLDAIRIIVRGARPHLRDGGWLLFEHGYDQGDAARALLEQSVYTQVFTARDLENRERVSGGEPLSLWERGRDEGPE
ncbi:MAG: peptide chain release factor N(5)-glutamine methyltransferase [Rhodanobacteraceae bacterium]